MRAALMLALSGLTFAPVSRADAVNPKHAVRFNAPGIGEVRAFLDRHWVPLPQAAELNVNNVVCRLICLDSSGKRLLATSLGRGESCEIKLVTIPGIESRVLIGTHDIDRADGEDICFTLVGVVGGRLRELFPRHIVTDSENALCFGTTENGELPDAALIEWDLNDEACIMCWPKRFKITRFRLSGNRFYPIGRVVKTKHRHPNWRDALAEFGINCEQNVIESSAKPDEDIDDPRLR